MGSDPHSIAGSVLANPSSKVKVVFVPTYLNGRDGIFDKSYYELLVGMDMTLFPSYYEPWGYTPHESTAFSYRRSPHAGRIRTLGRFSGRTRGRDARRTQRRQLRRSGSRNRQGAAAFHQIYPAGGRNRPQRRRRTVAHGPVERTLRSLRKSLFRSNRTFGDPYQPCGAQRRRRRDRTDQFRAAAAHHRKTHWTA